MKHIYIKQDLHYAVYQTIVLMQRVQDACEQRQEKDAMKFIVSIQIYIFYDGFHSACSTLSLHIQFDGCDVLRNRNGPAVNREV